MADWRKRSDYEGRVNTETGPRVTGLRNWPKSEGNFRIVGLIETITSSFPRALAGFANSRQVGSLLDPRIYAEPPLE
jgi:hypothetical protein